MCVCEKYNYLINIYIYIYIYIYIIYMRDISSDILDIYERYIIGLEGVALDLKRVCMYQVGGLQTCRKYYSRFMRTELHLKFPYRVTCKISMQISI